MSLQLLVGQPGLLTTVQDLGRYGYGSIGLPAAGVMDEYAASVANFMLGNEAEAAVLEITLLGPTLTAVGSGLAALVGGDLGAKLNGIALPVCGSFWLHEGDVLSFRGGTGSRTYLALAGGIDIALVLHSRSTFLRGKLGGFQGRALMRGDLIAAGAAAGLPAWYGRLPERFWPQSQGERQLIRVLLGPQGDFFGAAEKLSFFTQTWQVSKDSDRMGYRLEGEALHHLDKKEIVSDGVMKGAIQVPGHGQPIVLLADAQTTGGYPKIATVIGPDLGKFAYFSAGNRLRFQEVSYEAALQARRDRNAQYAAIKNWLAGQTTPTSHLYRISVKGEVFTVRVDEKLE